MSIIERHPPPLADYSGSQASKNTNSYNNAHNCRADLNYSVPKLKSLNRYKNRCNEGEEGYDSY